MIRGEALIANGQFEEGFEEIVAGMDVHRGMDAITYQPFWISLFVRGLMAAGRHDEALGALAQAWETSERTGERFYRAELLRLRGEIFASKGRPSEAELWLREAIQLSREQGARLFELRSAVSLCELLQGPLKASALRDVLKPVYQWFEEGTETPDLQAARALLGSRAGIN
jgi:hypothetical protein